MCLYAGNGKTDGSSPGIALHASLGPTDLWPCVLLPLSGLALNDVTLSGVQLKGVYPDI